LEVDGGSPLDMSRHIYAGAAFDLICAKDVEKHVAYPRFQ